MNVWRSLKRFLLFPDFITLLFKNICKILTLSNFADRYAMVWDLVGVFLPEFGRMCILLV